MRELGSEHDHEQADHLDDGVLSTARGPSGESLAKSGAAATDRIGQQPDEKGIASFYGTSTKAERAAFHHAHPHADKKLEESGGDGCAGQRMANGEAMDPKKMIAAHKTLPLGTVVRVRNPANSTEVTVTITDRGPYEAGRIIDLSPAAAKVLDFIAAGHTDVELFIESGQPEGKPIDASSSHPKKQSHDRPKHT